MVKRSFGRAERLVGDFFRLGESAMKVHRYDVKTLASLSDHEISDTAFAQLCRYRYNKDGKEDHPDNFYFFNVCLQDNRILDAVDRSRPFVKLVPLLLYIATHEIVHVVRFNAGESDFDAGYDEKVREEEKVHSITRNILHPLADREMGVVMDCFDHRYHIGDIVPDTEIMQN